AFVPLFAGYATLNFALLGLGILAMIPAAIIALYLALALSLVVPSIMLEDVGVLASFRESWQMTKGHKLSIFAALLVLGLISGAITIALAFPVGAFADPIASFFVQLIVGGILGSWNVIAPAVTYDLVAREPRYAPYGGWVGPPGAYPAPPSGPP
ncbi:MAG: glycerophosphoryl diester phosphodiesterase membrane domain-containing protein, partial [Methanobacteriota archaeon]